MVQSRSSLRRDLRANRPRIAIAIAALIGLGLVLTAIGIAWTIGETGRGVPELAETEVSWPVSGTAALALGDSVFVSPGGDTPHAIASLTKLVTTLVVLDAAPLTGTDPGPSFAMDEADAMFARAEMARGGRFEQVTPGEVLSERQLLEYVLIASSNNHATSLVSHVFGDEQSYLTAARRWLDDHGLPNMSIADASGMSPGNQASARDLVEIGRLASAQPVIVELTAMPSVLSPRGDTLTNTNDLLGTLGVSGLKTGHTDTAGYTVLFTVPMDDDGGELIGVILGSPSMAQRTTDVTRLIAQVRSLAAE